MSRKIIQISDHPSNGDATAKLVWAEGSKSVYSVKGGFIAIVGWPFAAEGLFGSLAEARDFSLNFRPA